MADWVQKPVPGSIKKGDSTYCEKAPCHDCPFRKKTALAPMPREAAAALRQDTVQGFGQAVFACHQSTPESARACTGYVMVEGAKNISVRFAALTGRFNPDELRCNDELYESVEAMIKANGIK